MDTQAVQTMFYDRESTPLYNIMGSVAGASLPKRPLILWTSDLFSTTTSRWIIKGNPLHLENLGISFLFGESSLLSLVRLVILALLLAELNWFSFTLFLSLSKNYHLYSVESN